MTRTIIFFEDSHVENFYPLSLSHTPAELLCGILSLGDKWTARIEHTQFRFITRGYLKNPLRVSLGRAVNDLDEITGEQIVLINPRYIPTRSVADQIQECKQSTSFYVSNQVCAVVTSSNSSLISSLSNLIAAKGSNLAAADVHSLIEDAASRMERKNVELNSASYLWDLVHHNGTEIVNDFELLVPDLNFSEAYDESDIDEGALIYEEDDVYIGKDARIDGQVVLDARSGPIYIGNRVIVLPHTRVEGPAYIGDDCQLVGGKVRAGCSLGEFCRVGGEIEESIFLGYSNKYHEGFIGHAYVGEWVNFGALTTNSDLKNNYGNIKVEMPQGMVDTKLNKVGSLIGDHTKTGIGTLLTTGMVVGFGVNLFGGGLAPGKSLPSLVWGGKDGFVDYRVDQAIDTAKVVLSRRGKTFSAQDEELFRNVERLTHTAKESFLKS